MTTRTQPNANQPGQALCGRGRTRGCDRLRYGRELGGKRSRRATGAYATLILAYSDTLSRLSNVPWAALTSIGIPALALISTYLMTGRNPRSINRPVID